MGDKLGDFTLVVRSKTKTETEKFLFVKKEKMPAESTFENRNKITLLVSIMDISTDADHSYSKSDKCVILLNLGICFSS